MPMLSEADPKVSAEVNSDMAAENTIFKTKFIKQGMMQELLTGKTRRI